jgi:hypothetical protein
VPKLELARRYFEESRLDSEYHLRKISMRFPNALRLFCLTLVRSAAGIAVAIGSLQLANAAPLAFPGAEGFGALATGGRGGAVVHVTNLDDAGTGSLRDAVSQAGRIVVFDTSGIIHLKSQLTCASNLTIAGQSAPGDGITVADFGISFSNQSNVIVRFMRFRSSHLASRGSKSLNVTEGGNMVFDHCSISWGRWDNLGFTGGAHDITLQDCIVSEACNPQRLGALIDSARNITVARTLWMSNQSRNPKGKADIQFINNVVYNWGGSGFDGGHSGAVWNQDLINNYFIKGPASNDSFLAQFTKNDHVFQSGNMADLNCNGELAGREVTVADFRANSRDGESATIMPGAFNNPSVPVKVLPAADAYARIAEDAGASTKRDPTDVRLIAELRSLGTKGAVINEETQVGGVGELKNETGPKDTDGDGIPDEWETSHGLNPTDAADAGKISEQTGYTRLEEYLNSLAPSR